MNKKVIKLEELGIILNKLKEKNKVIVYCHGVFDLLHPGHIKHFQAAKKFGDVLVVSLTEDKYVNKGPGRPVFDETIRAETIAAIEVVDFVTINNAPTAVPAINIIKPDFYVKGKDYKKASDDISGEIVNEQSAVEKYGGKLVFTDEIHFSSSKLINRYIDNTSKEIDNYLKKIRNVIDFEGIKKRFEDIAKYKVLVIGDIILDEYQFICPLGKSSKAAAITAKMINNELYAGGALAVANHIADFVDQVTLLSNYGVNGKINYIDFINKHLKENVDFNSIFTPKRPTTLKRRFIDVLFNQNLFEIIEIYDSPLEQEYKDQLFDKLKNIEKKFDLIVVADFGHGLIDKEVVEQICNKNIFLSVNVQTNSANKGFNLLTKYPRCDYFAIDEEEAHLAVHDQFLNIIEVQNQLIMQTNAQKAAITLGVKGSIVADSISNCQALAPVLSNQVVDTVGAGDAFLSITSLLAKQGASVEEIAFVGNAVGAMAVKILGNKSYIQKVQLLKYIKTLLS